MKLISILIGYTQGRTLSGQNALLWFWLKKVKKKNSRLSIFSTRPEKLIVLKYDSVHEVFFKLQWFEIVATDFNFFGENRITRVKQ